jgi:hypothetical protein
MPDYFEAYNKHEEKETAISLPDTYAFFIRYYDTELKEKVDLTHRLIPRSITQLRPLKDNDVLLIITFGDTVLHRKISSWDYKKHIAIREDFNIEDT